MSEKPKEGPKARFSAEEASEAYIPRPPSEDEQNKVSEAQELITDEWTGDPLPAKPKT
ncbi:hypothetical protein [Teichococcus vastitatis]|uniref:Uncharacterized protein n=1 Tax=Teichococcus vastitatis TaxID=2307076 RepID=A0ABS9W4B2_9PROT|nr:hypothetical protein [Pseudoroseomonas vastitatis]MCI0754122.1 hypothetical protein [Pseudoroseomonas vastitatis]